VTPHLPAFNMSDIERVAIAIAQGGLFGSRDPQAVLTLCLLAHAEGQHPAVVFRDYHIIQGKPAKKADAMLRDFITAGGKVEWHTLTDAKADATFTHPSGSARIDWTLERAKKAGIAGNPMWTKYPRQMLRSRVISEGVRTVFPGATSGLYEENEVRDIQAERNPAVETQDGGVLEGQFEEANGEPQNSADTTTETAKPKGWREPDSVYSTPTKLHAALARLERELHGCGDTETLDCLTLTEEWTEFVKIAEKHSPHYLYGGEPAPEEFVGLLTKAQKMRDEFQLEIATGMVDRLAAG